MIHSPSGSSFSSSALYPNVKHVNLSKMHQLIPSVVLYILIYIFVHDNAIASFSALFVAIIGTEFKLSILIMISLLVLTITVPLDDILAGYQEHTIWLVWAAFHLGTAVHRHLSQHITITLLYKFCFSWYSMSLCISTLEIVFAAIIPSNTARGGLILPIVQNMMNMLDRSYSRYLTMLACFSNLVSSSLWMYGMATNPLVVEFMLRYKLVEFSFFNWVSGAFLPTLILVLTLPFLLRRFLLFNQEDSIPLLRNQINADFMQLPKLAFPQFTLIIVLSICLLMWMTVQYHNISSTIIALLATLTLILLDIISWDDVLSNKNAWDTFFWLGGFLSIIKILQTNGITQRIGESIGDLMTPIHSPVFVTILISLVYFFSMYMFSGCSSHSLALAPPLLMSGIQLNCPPKLLLAYMCYFTTLSGLLTHYSSGPVVMYYSLDHINSKLWLKIGLLTSLYVLALYFSVGLLWFKILGFY
eukprot:NODE_109_length_19684_cov_0.566709.p2 type:complete len:473 gc:universal NODE_109_length_19684_cov_0.566709:15528-14110(-)